jgi:predicted metal-dependent hydrolase
MLKQSFSETYFDYQCLDGTLLKCRHKRRAKQKNLYLRIKSDGTIEISTPYHFSKKEALKFLAQRESWVCSRLSHNLTYAKNNPTEYYDGCKIWFLGREFPVKLERSLKNSIEFKDDHFLFKAKEFDKLSVSLDRFYLRKAKEILPARVELFSNRMKLYPKDLKFRRYKRRLGCCSFDNVITLNSHLLRYDMPLIDYVIIHELAHIRHKHHQKSFWKLVEQYEPEWKMLRKQLV